MGGMSVSKKGEVNDEAQMLTYSTSAGRKYRGSTLTRTFPVLLSTPSS